MTNWVINEYRIRSHEQGDHYHFSHRRVFVVLPDKKDNDNHNTNGPIGHCASGSDYMGHNTCVELESHFKCDSCDQGDPRHPLAAMFPAAMQVGKLWRCYTQTDRNAFGCTNGKLATEDGMAESVKQFRRLCACQIKQNQNNGT